MTKHGFHMPHPLRWFHGHQGAAGVMLFGMLALLIYGMLIYLASRSEGFGPGANRAAYPFWPPY